MTDKDKLMAMLSGAKQVMDKVNSGDYATGNISENSIMQDTGTYLSQLPEGAVAHRPVSNKPIQQTHQGIAANKLPPNIYKAMIENPIPVPNNFGGGSTFSAEDVQELIKPRVNERVQQPTYNAPISNVQITNTAGQMLISITEAELDKKINDALLKFMAETFSRNLTENTIKKTISTLIREGKIKVNAKPVK